MATRKIVGMTPLQEAFMKMMAIKNLSIGDRALNVWEEAGIAVSHVCGAHFDPQSGEKRNDLDLGKASELRAVVRGEQFRNYSGIGLGVNRSSAYTQRKGLRLLRLGYLSVIPDSTGTRSQQRSKQPSSYERAKTQWRRNLENKIIKYVTGLPLQIHGET